MVKMEEFLSHDEDFIRETAEIVQGYIDSGMSRSEIEEITQDLLELTQIDDEVDSIERKIIFEKAFEAMKVIISTLPL